MAFLVGYDMTTSSLTFTVREDRFPMHSNKLDPSHIPDPVVSGEDFNRNILISSSKPGYVNVDWGDGTKEQFPLVKQKGGNYKIIFRTLDVEYRKNPDATTWWFLKEDGSQYIPIPYHRYKDSSEKTVIMSFTGKIDNQLNFDGIYLYEWPVMDVPDLTYLGASRTRLDNGDIPFDKIGRSVNITEIQLGALSHNGTWSNWPDGLLKLKDLKIFGCNSVFNFADDPDSNWREMSVWTKLINFNFNWNNVPKYVPYFNQIPSVGINIISDRANIPTFEEVDKVADKITGLNFIGNASTWKDDLVRGKLNKIQSTYVTSGTIPVDALPDWFYETREFRILDASDSGGRFVNTQIRMDTFVNTMYEATTGWEQSTMSQTAKDGKRNQFYGLTLILYNVVSPHTIRPTGTYQAPEGFIQGQSNGNPVTPMEKVYALTMNYAQRWILPPEPTMAAMARIRPASGRIEPFVLGVYDGEAHVMSGDILGYMDGRYGFTCEEEGVEICEKTGLDPAPVIEYFKRIKNGEV